MNKEISEAVVQLFSACLEVTAHGEHHAFCDYQAHVGWLEVMVYPACANYQADFSEQRLLNSRIAIDGWGVETPEEIARALQQINETTGRLYGLAEIKEAA
jgi:hypothetical protein